MTNNNKEPLTAESAALEFLDQNEVCARQIFGYGYKYKDLPENEIAKLTPQEKNKMNDGFDNRGLDDFIKAIEMIGASNFRELGNDKKCALFEKTVANDVSRNRMCNSSNVPSSWGNSF